MAENNLKPCPFCGFKDIRSGVLTVHGGAKVGIVFCVDCGAQLRYRNDEQMAIELWNRRANNGRE
jgi:Lar family restriction alleviation protein